ncbi:hypothetical protein BOTBODRAFT_190144 [Botryobasidium botryosum FD-172 SS1]|uniref:Protein kinase domain-containing protein n=1 Tax=Botryobasidium botryosum (strain FD-172 SS1) TaxID=930990 RepID=A0A067MHF7_BOTB1|nr:hypothetical protein BOTBODRAFT_190144 [Botryobasidium botryosum FD-172 SS1]
MAQHSGTPTKVVQAMEHLTLDDRRTYLTDGIAESRCIPPQEFVDNLLPKANARTLKKTQTYLESHSVWKHFKANPPHKSAVDEDRTFKPFTTLVNDVVAHYAKAASVKATVTACCEPSKTPGGGALHDTRPDGVLLLGLPPQPLHWDNIPLTFEFKKHLTKPHWEENVKKMLWNMTHVMANDCCRRHTFGITIENLHMRLWFCDRSGFVISDSFDFIKSPSLVAQIFASLGTASSEQLGYDPTMTRVYVDGEEQFDIEVHSETGTRTFRTVYQLSNTGADRVRSRATRVWVVYEKCNPSKLLVLKDVWIEDDRTREGTIYEEVLEAIGPEDMDRAKAHFLTIICHGDVMLKKPGGHQMADNTKDSIRGGYVIPQSDSQAFPKLWRKFASAPLTTHAVTTEIGSIPELSPAIIGDLDTGKFYSRTHYRIVFGEVGIPVKDVTRMDQVLRALEGAANGLDILDKHDFIHRDVSVTNILLVDGVGKISDFEFVHKTRLGAIGSAEVKLDGHPGRTGTRHFMASELRYNRYIYRSRRFKAIRWVFKQNTMHDAEALWWVLIWILAWKCPKGDHPQDDVDNASKGSKDLRRYALIMELFPPADHYNTVDKRHTFFDDPAEFEGRVACLQPDYEKLVSLAGDLRDGLCEYYDREQAWTAEAGPDEQVFKGIYGGMVVPKLRSALEENDVGELRTIKTETK